MGRYVAFVRGVSVNVGEFLVNGPKDAVADLLRRDCGELFVMYSFEVGAINANRSVKGANVNVVLFHVCVERECCEYVFDRG